MQRAVLCWSKKPKCCLFFVHFRFLTTASLYIFGVFWSHAASQKTTDSSSINLLLTGKSREAKYHRCWPFHERDEDWGPDRLMMNLMFFVFFVFGTCGWWQDSTEEHKAAVNEDLLPEPLDTSQSQEPACTARWHESSQPFSVFVDLVLRFWCLCAASELLESARAQVVTVWLLSGSLLRSKQKRRWLWRRSPQPQKCEPALAAAFAASATAGTATASSASTAATDSGGFEGQGPETIRAWT